MPDDLGPWDADDLFDDEEEEGESGVEPRDEPRPAERLLYALGQLYKLYQRSSACNFSPSASARRGSLRTMPLDPIVSLAVAIAERPGSYAFLLGSGVSRDAGVPTGGEVLWRAVGELYRLERVTEETPDDPTLQAWLVETGRAELTYSDVLELIAPDPATRRDYLAKHFEGAVPGTTHELLADMASEGLIRVFVTTNFDRLLEQALQARGIQPMVVTADADLASAPRREHESCWVLKVHGDYLQQTIRNTPAELAQLEPEVTRELAEVFDRYGVVVLGYSGADPAVAAAMRARGNAYGLYWLARGELAEPGRSIVEAVSGRVVTRPGAAEFLADLRRRLAVFAEHPSGQTPIAVNAETVALLRAGDRVGLQELLREERRFFEDAVLGYIAARQGEQPTAASARAAHDDLLPALERRLASLLPLVIHDVEALDAEVEQLGELKERVPQRDGFTFWADLVNWCWWWLGYTVGAFAVRQRHLGALKGLLAARAIDRHHASEPLVQSIPGNTGHEIGTAVLAAQSDTRWLVPAFESLRGDLGASELLREQYPEFASTAEEPLRSLTQFDFIVSIHLGLQDFRAGGHWTIYNQVANDFARRLHGDARLRGTLAEALGVELDDFDARAPAALAAARVFDGFGSQDASVILQTGQR